MLVSWVDFNSDGRLDLATVTREGSVRLLASLGEGRFEDATERAGLLQVRNAGLALWNDYDGDGRLDLFVGARQGASRLFHNEGGTFIDMSAGSGLTSEGPVRAAEWLDHDGDGRLDLFVVTEQTNELFRGLEGGFFERAELPFAGAVNAPAADGSLSDTDRVKANGAGGGELGTPTSADDEGRTRAGGPIVGTKSLNGVNTAGGSTAVVAQVPYCPYEIRDWSGGTCIRAKRTPGTAGYLYPLSQELFVTSGGDVGMGTLTPSYNLEVFAPADPTFGVSNGGGAGLRIGVASCTSCFSQVATTGDVVIDARHNTTQDLILQAANGNNPSIRFALGGTGTEVERMTIRNSGNVGIGTNAPTERLHVIGNVNANGTIYTSDRRFKTNVVEMQDTLAKVLKLRGVEFDWRRDEFPERSFCDGRQVGFIAQEVKEVVPEIVVEGSDGYLAVDYSKLTPLLVEAVRELHENDQELQETVPAQAAEIEALRKRVARLEGLEAQLQRLEAAFAATSGSK